MKIAYIIITTIGICSCNSLDGKIDIRQNNSAYVVNTSEEKTKRFTIKKTRSLDNKDYKYFTEVIQLPPGDELYLGMVDSVIPGFYKTTIVDSLIFEPNPYYDNKDYKPTKIKYSEQSTFKEAYENSMERAKTSVDTVINGVGMKSRTESFSTIDSSQKNPDILYKFKYEVTGASDVKIKDQY